jgi:transcription initiation factor TFIID subunit 4
VIDCNFLIWQHITLQAIGGLQPGAQGHILVKTENGQLQLLRVGSIGQHAGGIQTAQLGPGGAPGTTTLRFQSVPVSQAQRPGMTMQQVTTTSQGVRLVGFSLFK